MIFVTADCDRIRLERLTKFLMAEFPGSTVYQHTDPARATGDVMRHKVSGVFLTADAEAADGIDLMQLLRRQRPEVPVFILSRTEALREQAIRAGAAGYLLHPLSRQLLKDAVTALSNNR